MNPVHQTALLLVHDRAVRLQLRLRLPGAWRRPAVPWDVRGAQCMQAMVLSRDLIRFFTFSADPVVYALA